MTETFIEILGAGFINKGAELMLVACLQKLRTELGDAQFVIKPGDNTYSRRASLGLWQKSLPRRYGLNIGECCRVIPERLRRRYGLVLESEISVFIDASGYAYGDIWETHRIIEAAENIRRWRNRGAKVILLPQAMGPFNKPAVRRAVTEIVHAADLVFPRDSTSYQHVESLVGPQAHILQAPDFTASVTAILPEVTDRFQGAYCIIPNHRMIDKTEACIAAQYREVLAMCTQYLCKAGERVFFLIHEGEQDLRLAQEIIALAGLDAAIVVETDVRVIKGIISLCSGVISSRYHGLVSALVQGVPVLATSWSHKYEALLTEYGLPNHRLPEVADSANIIEKVTLLLDDECRSRAVREIQMAESRRSEMSESMWRLVVGTIRN